MCNSQTPRRFYSALVQRAAFFALLIAGFLVEAGCGKSEIDKKIEELHAADAALKAITQKLEADTKALDAEEGITSRKLFKNWVVLQGANRMDGVKFVQIISVPADNPELVIRCKGKKRELLLATHGVVTDGTVRLKFDDGKPVTQQWDQSDSYDTLFSQQPVALVKQLVGAKILMLEYRPYHKGPELLLFQIDGLKDAISEASTVCTWIDADRATKEAPANPSGRTKVISAPQ